MESKLEFIATFKEATKLGMNNAIPLLITVVIYLLTCWIPYLNIGTSIAMATIPSKLAHGETLNPTFIFDSVYRRQIGNYLLFLGLYTMMLLPTILSVLFIPALPVLFIMYSLSLFILLDRETTPIEALEMSRQATYGFKWKIFFLLLVFSLAFYIIPQLITLPVIGIAWLLNAASMVSSSSSDLASSAGALTFITTTIWIVFFIVGVCCYEALLAVIYRELYLKAEEQPEEPAAPKEIERVFRQEIEATPIGEIKNNSSDTVVDSTISNEKK